MTKPSTASLLLSFLLWTTLSDTTTAFSTRCIAKRRSLSTTRAAPPLHHGGSTSTALTSAVSPISNTDGDVSGWRGKLLRASNIASLLCVLDCTVLPVVTVVLPFFGMVAASPAQMEFLHQLGHSAALFFVLPVGGSATLLNYLYAHKQKRIAAVGILGLLMVLAANAPHSWLHKVHHGFLSPLYPLLHAAHHGITHRLVNILGCACLLASNLMSKSGQCFLACCDPRRLGALRQQKEEGLSNFVTHAYANGDRFVPELVVFHKDGTVNRTLAF